MTGTCRGAAQERGRTGAGCVGLAGRSGAGPEAAGPGKRAGAGERAVGGKPRPAACDGSDECGTRRFRVRAQCPDPARGNRRRGHGLDDERRQAQQGRCRADAGLDVLAGDGGDRAVPGREVVLRATGGRAASAAVGDEHGGADRAGRALVQADAAGVQDVGARKPGRAAGASVPSGILAQGSFDVRERPAPEPAGLVAAGRYRRGSVVDFRRGGGLAGMRPP